jgi:hypothetical protein
MATTTICHRVTSPLLLPDNRTGRCQDCHISVQYRPNAPKGPKLCLQCASDLLTGEETLDMQNQLRMLEEARDQINKRRQ